MFMHRCCHRQTLPDSWTPVPWAHAAQGAHTLNASHLPMPLMRVCRKHIFWSACISLFSTGLGPFARVLIEAGGHVLIEAEVPCVCVHRKHARMQVCFWGA